MRWGKPTKNKKKRDPRYFLNEGIMDMIPDIGDMADIATGALNTIAGVQNIICPYKRVIFLALDNPTLAKMLPKAIMKNEVIKVFARVMETVSQGTMDSRTAVKVATALYDVFGDDLRKLATDPSVKPMIKSALDIGCRSKR